MTVLVDHQIRLLCAGVVPPKIHALYDEELPTKIKPLVEPFDINLINPASLDIRIGFTAKLRVRDGYKEIDFAYGTVTKERPFLMQPGDRLLVASLETINLPNFLTAQFRLKSSRGREWYEHMEAGFADPGWHDSKLTMEIINMDCEPLPIYPGLKMGQLIFSLTLGIPDKDYSVTGRYNNDKTVMESKG